MGFDIPPCWRGCEHGAAAADRLLALHQHLPAPAAQPRQPAVPAVRVLRELVPGREPPRRLLLRHPQVAAGGAGRVLRLLRPPCVSSLLLRLSLMQPVALPPSWRVGHQHPWQHHAMHSARTRLVHACTGMLMGRACMHRRGSWALNMQHCTAASLASMHAWLPQHGERHPSLALSQTLPRRAVPVRLDREAVEPLLLPERVCDHVPERPPAQRLLREPGPRHHAVQPVRLTAPIVWSATLAAVRTAAAKQALPTPRPALCLRCMVCAAAWQKTRVPGGLSPVSAGAGDFKGGHGDMPPNMPCPPGTGT